ncbi:MAG: PxKF domain-containing protein [Blastocatellales bacterium]
MKRRITISATILTLIFGLAFISSGRLMPNRQSLAAGKTETPLPNLQGEAASSYLKEKGLHASLGEAVEAARYGVWPIKAGSKESFSASNPVQRYRSYFSSDQVRIATADQRNLRMKLTGIGYGERTAKVGAAELHRQGQRIEYRRDGLTEWYVNERRGLEQGFTLREAPGARSGDEKLRLTMEMSGDLKAAASPDGDTALMKDSAGRVVLRYSGLKVWDSANRTLPARLTVKSNEIAIEVDDRGAVYPVTIDPVLVSETAKLEASDKDANDQFGVSVSIDGDTAIVGAPREDLPGIDSGAAYIFERNLGGANNWGEARKIEATDGGNYHLFGNSVGISGDTVIVGAPWEADSGAVYIFERNLGGANNWGEIRKIKASDVEAYDSFGISVGISGDTVIVGANWEGDSGDQTGAAYIFERNLGGAGNWGEAKKVKASDKEPGDQFGTSVSISGDTAIVGAIEEDLPGYGSGAAYIIERNQGGTGNWGEVKKLEASDAIGYEYFGWSVSINGDIAVVGMFNVYLPYENSGSAYVFERNQGGAGNWGEVKKLEASDKEKGDAFGFSVSISGDIIIVGSPGETNPGIYSGAAYVYKRNQGGANNWGEVSKLDASDNQAIDNFGCSVGISEDTAITGAFFEDDPGDNSGAAYIFVLSDSSDSTPPVISPQTITRQQTAAGFNSTIAGVSDNLTAAGSIVVELDGALPSGISVTNLLNMGGVISADVAADCSAATGDHLVALKATDEAGQISMASFTVTVTPETTPPVISCPDDVVVYLPLNSMDTGMAVDYPAPTATDNCDSSPTISVSQASGTVFPVGTTTVNVTATDDAGNQSSCSFKVTVLYNFSGFGQPLGDPSTINLVKAGGAVPVKFSLSGNKGLDILAPGFPISQQVACDSGASVSEIEETVTAGGSSLSYAPTTDTYTYVWKTSKAWSGTCRVLTVKFKDGSSFTANFRFK